MGYQRSIASDIAASIEQDLLAAREDIKDFQLALDCGNKQVKQLILEDIMATLTCEIFYHYRSNSWSKRLKTINFNLRT